MAPSQASALARGRAAYGRLLRACAVVSGLLTFAMMVLVVANALSRFFLNAPIVGTLEITESTLCVLIFLSVGFTQYEGGHIHVTLVLQRMSAGARHALALLAAVLGLAFFAWSAWSAWGFAMKSLAMNEQEWGAIRFPLYPVKFVIFAGLLLLAGQFVLDALWVIAGGRPAHDEDLAGATEPWSGLVIGAIGVVALFAAILVGVNVMVALGLVGALGLAALVGFKAATAILSTVFFDTTNSFHFSVIPLFLLMGFFAMRAGLGEDMFEASMKWFGGLRGGLAIATTMGAAAFGAASGSSVGTATVFTKLALPQMLDRGYDKRLASASIAIAGTLAVMIPPSALVVVYGILTDSSIGALLIAGIIPGFVFAALLCLATYLTVLRNPALAPAYPSNASLREKLYSLRLAGPLLLVVVCIIGALYLGIFTPTEAGGLGAALTLLLALARQRSWARLRMTETLLDTVKVSAMIFAIIVSALVFSKFLALSGVANALGSFLTELNVNRWVIVMIVVVIYLFLGMLMDAPALLAITLPITHPVMLNLGFDPVWFGVFVVLLVEIGAVTPPVGINCFVVQSASDGRVALEDVFRGLMPYVLAGLVMLVLLCLLPQMALFLPGTMK